MNIVVECGKGKVRLCKEPQILRISGKLRELFEIPVGLDFTRECFLNTFCIDPESTQIWQRVSRGLSNHCIPYSINIIMNTYKGSTIWVNIVGNPLLEDDQLPMSMSTFSRVKCFDNIEKKLDALTSKQEELIRHLKSERQYLESEPI